jgi:oxygen-independent coproporphyrinogen III oxidase
VNFKFADSTTYPSSPVHLYLHIPFCHHLCPYCGFYKHTPGNLANRDFVDAILSEADRRGASSLAPRTVYLGGGTPSLLSPTLLERLLCGLAERFDLSQVAEYTMEANPATYDLEKARLMRELGVDRISLGVQSFQASVLQTLGRDHSPDDAIAAFETLRDAGFENLSLDLMFSIPGQDLALWQADLDQALALAPEHFSAYNLTYEEDTEFLTKHQQGELDSDEDRDATLFHAAIDRLEAAGYAHYEVSNYARPGFESRHNRAYWAGADYLGLGPGAVSTMNGERWKTLPDTAAYVRAMKAGIDTRVEIEILSAEDRRLEAVAMRLRTREGVPLDLLPTPDPLESLIEEGWVVVENDHVRLTRDGKALADPIAGMLV